MAFGYTVITTWILFLYFDVASSRQAVEVKPSVFVRSGSSVDLTCTYNTRSSDGFTLEWRYAAPGTPAVQAERILYYNGRLYWVNSWEGRMALIQNPPVSGVASLRIISAEIFDAGVYICEVTNPTDWSGSGHGLINLTVLVPPSVPVCQLQGNTYPGSDVTLGCQSSQGLPSPIYSWHREHNTDLLLPADTFIEDQRSGFLTLNNLSETFAGVYTCTAANELGHSECSITLRVTYGETATVVGEVLMGIFLVLLLAGITVVCVSRKRLHVQKTHTAEPGQVNSNSAPHQNGGKSLPVQPEIEDKSDFSV